jgi:hypothetical protein
MNNATRIYGREGDAISMTFAEIEYLETAFYSKISFDPVILNAGSFEKVIISLTQNNAI